MHNNAIPHVTKRHTEKDFNSEYVSYLPYFSDLVVCNYRIFMSLFHSLHRKRYITYEEVKKEIKMFLFCFDI